MTVTKLAPEWDCSVWLNSNRPLTLSALRGKPIVAAAFQMLCPGCVAKTIPQLNEVRSLFADRDLTVLGLHSVFEHHEAMLEPSLRAFLHEYQVHFPVGIDRHDGDSSAPITMRRYGLRGTPTLMLIDAQGVLRRQTFGHVPDLQLGAEIMALVRDTAAPDTVAVQDTIVNSGADAGKCEVGKAGC